MATFETKSNFFVYALISDTSNPRQEHFNLVKAEAPYEGHISHSDAAQWIKDDGKTNVEYTILEVFKRV